MQYMYTERAHLMCPQMYFGIVETEALYEAFQSRAGAFVGGNMFGYKLRNGYSITNLGRIENDAVGEADIGGKYPDVCVSFRGSDGDTDADDHLAAAMVSSSIYSDAYGAL